MILIIDDEAMVRDTTSRMLQRRGYTVLEAEDGEQGLELYRQHGDKIRLILLDQSMPHLSGREVLTQLRALGTTVKVIIITGIPSELDEFDGADALLEKPFSLASLVTCVRATLEQP